MTLLDASAALNAATSGWRLLDHPYYRRWQAGTLSVSDLASYAAQYRHVERCLPDLLATTAGQLDDGPVRRLVERNLADERGNPTSHLELFDAFAAAVEAADEPATPATLQLVRTYEEAARTGPIEALSTVGAYEIQAAEIART
ncbi:MAG TPA: hypothetical protein VGI06_09765, partial [Acidimicrobiales bacterium]